MKTSKKEEKFELLAMESKLFQPFKIQRKACLGFIYTGQNLYLNIQASNWAHSGLRVCVDWHPVFSIPKHLQIESADHLQLPDINSILLPTPCSHLIAFKIAQCPTWKDYYSNTGSSFIGMEEAPWSGAGNPEGRATRSAHCQTFLEILQWRMRVPEND